MTRGLSNNNSVSHLRVAQVGVGTWLVPFQGARRRWIFARSPTNVANFDKQALLSKTGSVSCTRNDRNKLDPCYWECNSVPKGTPTGPEKWSDKNCGQAALNPHLSATSFKG